MRLSGVANVRLANAQAFATTDAGERFDLVLLIDVLPYLADPLPLIASLAGRLRPGASLIAMNWSYDPGLDRQRALVASFARDGGLVVVRRGTREFSLWDGAVFHFRKPEV